MPFGARGRAGCAAARFLLTAFAVAVLASGWVGAESEWANTPAGGGGPPTVTLGTLLTGTCREVQRYAESLVGSGVLRAAAEGAVLFLDSLLGQENVSKVAMFFEMVIRFLAEGAASGLNVIAVYVTEILRVTGFDVALSSPLFTPEAVAAIAQWGLVALIGYWVLTIVLRLLIGVVRRVFWVVKTVLALWLFGLIVTEKNVSADVTAVRLGGLVLACVLLTLLTTRAGAWRLLQVVYLIALSSPLFTPEAVAAIAQWGLVALIGYWVLTIVLRLLIGVVRRVFWVVKTVLALWLFGLIVTEKNVSADVTAVRLGGLVLACVLLTLLTTRAEKSCAVAHRLSSLEDRVKAVEKRKVE